MAEISVDAVLLLVMHGTGGAGRGGAPLEGPPPVQVRLGVTPGGFVVVAAETVPAGVLQPALLRDARRAGGRGRSLLLSAG